MTNEGKPIFYDEKSVIKNPSGRGRPRIHPDIRAAWREASRRYRKRKRRAAYHTSNRHDWTTPPQLLTSILRAVAREAFSLDPCSPSPDGPVPALSRYTEAEDGLSLPWSGLVFCNPPYGRALPSWIAKCAAEASAGATVVALIPARTDTRAWHLHVAGKADAILLQGRLRFGGAGKGAPFPSAVVVWGDPALAVRIAAETGGWLVPAD